MLVGHVSPKSVLVRSKIRGIPYTINPYIGCAFGCTYCYASFMAKYSGHGEPWGTFVDVKDNAPQLLMDELRKKRPTRILISSVTDPYQPLERRERVTRRCLEVLLDYSRWEETKIEILTRSPLVLRDIDLFQQFPSLEVGISVTTNDEAIRRIFEPKAPPIPARIAALETLRMAGIVTYAAISPILPMVPEALADMLLEKIERAFIDKLNYPWKASHLYRRHGLDYALEPGYVKAVVDVLSERLGKAGVTVEISLDP